MNFTHLKNFLFPFILKPSSSLKVRPYFGEILPEQSVGGPYIRTKRMINSFGNHRFNPNIVYANSVGIISLEKVKRLKSKHPGLKFVYNQNGLYYPGWYPHADFVEKNAVFKRFYHLSDHVIFQSEFCRKAFSELTQTPDPKGTVLYNGSPDFFSVPLSKKTGVKKVLLSALIREDGEHLIKPALEAVMILKEKLKSDCPKLILAGNCSSAALNSSWYPEVQALKNELQKNRLLEDRGSYSTESISEKFSDCDLALHLKYKDPCPNAVIERMSLGMGHVFSQSGGTPELVGDSGIGIPIADTWSEQLSVKSELLAQAIQSGLEQSNVFSERARARYLELFSWKNYALRHQEIFSSLLK